jgi:GT2 family glycosyltransferase/glycosyltransferase involved in cell wall biosynthesis
MNIRNKEAITASIIIVNYKVAHLINDCIQSIIDDPQKPEFEILLIDNSCDPKENKAVENLQKKWDQIHLVINEENVGFSKANNKGLSVAKGEYIVFLNPDTLVTPGWFENMKVTLEKNPDIGLISPLTNKVANYGALKFDSKIPKEKICSTGIKIGKILNASHIEMKGLGFFCAMGRRKVFEEVGNLNEDFITGGFEDDDYCYRIAKNGHKLALCLSSFVYHAQFKSFETIKFSERLKISETNQKIFEEKWGEYKTQLDLENFFFVINQLLGIISKKFDTNTQHLLDLPLSQIQLAEEEYRKNFSAELNLDGIDSYETVGSKTELKTQSSSDSSSSTNKTSGLLEYIESLETGIKEKEKWTKYIESLEIALKDKHKWAEYISSLEEKSTSSDKNITEYKKSITGWKINQWHVSRSYKAEIENLKTVMNELEKHSQSLEERVASKEEIILENEFRIGSLKNQIRKYEKIINNKGTDEREKLVFLQNEAGREKEEKINYLQSEILDLKNILYERDKLIALGLKSNHDDAFARKVGQEHESLKEENNTLNNSSDLLKKDADKNKKIFHYFFQEIGEMPKVLSKILESKAYKFIMFFRIFISEIKTCNVGRMLEFFRRLFSYAKGNRGVLTKYINEDPFFSILERLDTISTRLFSSRILHFDAGAIHLDIEGVKNEIQHLASPSSTEQVSYQVPGSTGKDGKSVVIFTNQLLDIASGHPRYGGGERYCIALVKLLKSQGFEVDIYQLGHEEFEGIYENFKVTAIPIGDRSYSEFNLSATDKFYEISLKYNRAIYFLPELCAGKMRPDAISVCHGIWFDHNNYGPNTHYRTKDWYIYLNRVFSNPQLTVSVDTNSIGIVRSLWPQMADKMRFIPNFYDPEYFYPPEKPRKNDPLVILFPRRSQVNRGSRILGDIISQIPHQVEIHWVGKGDELDTRIIKDLCKKDSRLSFHEEGFNTMSDWYKKADICVIPTIACEGTSLSCIEGLASGCAVVSTNVGGLPNLIQDQINGMLVDPFANDIAHAINGLIENPEERLRLQKAGAQSAKRFNIQEWQKKWTSILKHLKWLD